MNVKQLKRELNKQALHRCTRRKVSNLTDSLAYIAHIPNGRQLVMLIGSGNERSNIEALRTWVGSELRHCGLSEVNELDYLYARLQTVLGDWVNK